MSSTFKIAKKKYTQTDLRRLMQEQKMKAKQPIPERKIDSPLAKYNDLGQLTCVLCKSVVRSESVWKVHINTKQHRENVLAAKQLGDRLQSSTSQSTKRTGNVTEGNIPGKKARIEENYTSKEKKISQEKEQSAVPPDFFDSNISNRYFDVTLRKTSIKKDLVNIKREVGDENEVKSVNPKLDAEKSDVLPEGFFDDPIKDAKIRNLEYKDPQEEEWERFQREIREASSLSNAIIAEEREEATAERQIEEIEEQIQKWSKVLDLERRKEAVSNIVKQRSKMDCDEDDSESSGNDADFEEFLDWRAKRLQKLHS